MNTEQFKKGAEKIGLLAEGLSIVSSLFKDKQSPDDEKEKHSKFSLMEFLIPRE